MNKEKEMKLNLKPSNKDEKKKKPSGISPSLSKIGEMIAAKSKSKS